MFGYQLGTRMVASLDDTTDEEVDRLIAALVEEIGTKTRGAGQRPELKRLVIQQLRIAAELLDTDTSRRMEGA